MMSKKISVILDDENLEFVDQLTNNRSDFINSILQQERQKQFLQALAAAYEEQSNDTEFQKEFQVWDITVGDGISCA